MRAGELCAGYGGLALAVEEVFAAETAWFSEFDPAPSKILAHHWPNVPNHGDMTQIDWAAIEQVDIISGGTPCQDLSHAGKRKGMTEGTRSNLWVNMREAIAIQKPAFAAWENVRGAYSAEADSDLEYCAGCMGRDSDCNLRALGRVLGDLSDLGYDTQWRGLRAADVGAPHARFRVFILAYDPSRIRGPQAVKHDGNSTQADNRAGLPDQSNRLALRSGPIRAATPHAEGDGRNKGRAEPARIIWGPDDAFRRSEDLSDAIGCGRDRRSREARRQTWAGTSPEGGSEGIAWGEYEPAIRRWERTNGPAPRPTEPTGRDGAERLSPRFTEWMMGLPDGWVTDPAIGISRNDQLKACGNGVVPQQAAAALRDMLAAFASRELAA